jgi:putative tryptophan/tyrosine transport system substrate-binding protein
MHFDRLRRRAFITLIGGAAAWPLAALAQDPVMPVVAVVTGRSPEGSVQHTAGFRKG